MGRVKKCFDSFKQDVALVLQKPFLVLSIIVIGFFMIWFASEQVRTVLRVLIHLEFLDEKQVTRFSHKYLLFGLSLMGILWADLILINRAYSHLKSWYHAIRNYWHVRQNKRYAPDECLLDSSTLMSRRRYALRSYCRRDS